MARKAGVLKQKKAVPKDFVKQKHKVGKKKQVQNETRTDFKVKRVQMPAQSALDEKGDEVTHRKLGLLELLAHTGHHSPKVRRDAYRGLHELCSTHAGVLRSNLARVLEACTTAAIDSAAEVRAAFRIFQGWMVDQLPVEAVAAFAPTLALQVRSALSHVSAEVRDDGLLLLELYLSRLGGSRVFSQSEAARIIEILCQLTAQTDMVLICLYRLLEPPQDGWSTLNKVSDETTVSQIINPDHETQHALQSQITLQAVMQGFLSESVSVSSHDSESGETVNESLLWAFCIRVWLQAGDMQGGGRNVPRGTKSAAARPGWSRLRCAAVLERALHMDHLMHGSGGASWSMMLRPSPGQVKSLVNIVKRGEWPIRIDSSSPFSYLRDAINLRMTRVFAALATIVSEESFHHVAFLARTALAFLTELCKVPAAGFNISGGIQGWQSLASSADESAGDVTTLGGASSVAHAVCSLDLLWCCTSAFHSVSMGADREATATSILDEENDVMQLVSCVAGLHAGSSADDDDAARSLSAPAVLALPLAASVLGLRPHAAASGATPAGPPKALRVAWPSALTAAGEPCLAEAVERAMPSTAANWVAAWPKLLWYLGSSEPSLSAFVLGLILELAKQAVRTGSMFESLFSLTCPLLMPFFVGMPDASQDPPPLARLQSGNRGLAGPQGQAAALIAHFPKISIQMMARLSKLICRWSDIGVACDSQAQDGALANIGLSADCCELILEAIFRGRQTSAAEMLPARLRVALTVLCARPHRSTTSVSCSIREEKTALRLCDTVADWLMTEGLAASKAQCHGEFKTFDAATGLDYDSRRRLAVEILVWPLCARALAKIAECDGFASRALCFLFFCVVRVPWSPPLRKFNTLCDSAAEARLNIGACSRFPQSEFAFLHRIFHALVVESGGRAICPVDVRVTAVAGEPRCNPARCGGAEWMDDGNGDYRDVTDDRAGLSRRLSRMFVVCWMRSVAICSWAVAYELLVKLCAGRIASAEKVNDLVTACSLLITAAVSFRNEWSFSTAEWGNHLAPSPDIELELLKNNFEQTRGLLEGAIRRFGGGRYGLADMSAMLRLL